ncbi:MAG: hypothetical protein EBR01_13140 [Proteobacteria bacterium]|nr:hypothetical protein [Pseudomonadota bacterium]
MNPFKLKSIGLTLSLLLAVQSLPLMAEEEIGGAEESAPVEDLQPAQKAIPSPQTVVTPPAKKERKEKRYFGTEPEPRVDAGIFHVAFAGGANFFIEPKLNAVTKAPLGEYFNDFGFGGGVVFDFDYSQMAENIPLMLRGFVGYKYVLQSVHVFDVEGIVRRMWQFSDSATFGIGAGVSSAVWYRTKTDESLYEETLFLPSFVVETGFEFNPLMVELKWLVNRLGTDSSINGIEFLVGLRF